MNKINEMEIKCIMLETINNILTDMFDAEIADELNEVNRHAKLHSVVNRYIRQAYLKIVVIPFTQSEGIEDGNNAQA